MPVLTVFGNSRLPSKLSSHLAVHWDITLFHGLSEAQSLDKNMPYTFNSSTQETGDLSI